MAAIGSQLPTKPCQVQNTVDPTQQMIGRNPIVETELIEKSVLPTPRRSQHHQNPPLIDTATRNHGRRRCSIGFFNSLSHKRSFSSCSSKGRCHEWGCSRALGEEHAYPKFHRVFCLSISPLFQRYPRWIFLCRVVVEASPLGWGICGSRRHEPLYEGGQPPPLQ